MLGIKSSRDCETNKLEFIVSESGTPTDVQNYLKSTHKIHLEREYR